MEGPGYTRAATSPISILVRCAAGSGDAKLPAEKSPISLCGRDGTRPSSNDGSADYAAAGLLPRNQNSAIGRPHRCPPSEARPHRGRAPAVRRHAATILRVDRYSGDALPAACPAPAPSFARKSRRPKLSHGPSDIATFPVFLRSLQSSLGSSTRDRGIFAVLRLYRGGSASPSRGRIAVCPRARLIRWHGWLDR